MGDKTLFVTFKTELDADNFFHNNNLLTRIHAKKVGWESNELSFVKKGNKALKEELRQKWKENAELREELEKERVEG